VDHAVFFPYPASLGRRAGGEGVSAGYHRVHTG
jgi:hypothetical protein